MGSFSKHILLFVFSACAYNSFSLHSLPIDGIKKPAPYERDERDFPKIGDKIPRAPKYIKK